MPLSPPARRQPVHQRTIDCQGFQRADGLWDIEGRLLDIKSDPFPSVDRGGMIPAGAPLHEMKVRMTIDLDFVIHDVEAVIVWSPFAICSDIAEQMERLAGITIGPGWMKEVKARVGGAMGCTHLVELLGPLASTAFQTLFPAREARAAANDPQGAPPALLNNCYALHESSPVVARVWPDHHKPEES